VDDNARSLDFTYTGSRVSEIRDPIGRTVQYTYNASGRLETVTDPNGGVTTYTYDTEGRILTITDARNIRYIENIYSPSGRVLRQLQADGGEWRTRYQLVGASVTGPGCPGASCPTVDSWENFQAGFTLTGGTVTETTVVDPEGNTSTHRMNNLGFLVEQVDALGQSTSFTRDAANQIVTTTDPLGRTAALTYDGAGNVTSLTDPDGNITSYSYEPIFNKIASITDALNQVTAFTYDAKGNLTSTTNPLNQTTTLAYNPFGQPISITDPLGNTTTFEYDLLGNLRASIDPLGNRTQRVYDTVSRLLAVTNPLGRTTLFSYDPLNRVSQIQDARNGLTAFAYDPNGNLLNVTDANSNTTAYTYDVQDRLQTRTDPLLRSEAYTYDFNGNLKTFTDRKGQLTTFTYDPLNRRTQAQYADATQTAFNYDAVGRLDSVTESTSTLFFGYDNLDRLVTELTPQGIISYNYDILGRRMSMSVNGGLPVNYQYDANSRLTQVAQGPQIVGLNYDLAGRRTGLTYPNGTSASYAYDTASRLTNLTHQAGATPFESISYTYDAAGNRTGLDRTNGASVLLPDAVQAAYDAANEQIQFNSSTPNLTYDANGNLTSQTDASGTTSYTWDSRNRLISISGPATSASFIYDALGRRTSKTINGITTDYQYDGNDIVSEIGGGAVGAGYLRSLNIDEPFVRQSRTNEYYHVDALGSTLDLTDETGAVTTNYEYEAFGKTTVSGSSTNPFQYTGRENDGTNLYFYRTRYYNTNRFVSEDQLSIESSILLRKRIQSDIQIGEFARMTYISKIFYTSGSFNPYLYVLENPIRYRDPFGLDKGLDIDIALCGVFLVVGACVGSDGLEYSLEFPGLSIGGGVEININRPEEYDFSVWAGPNRFLSVGTNVIINSNGPPSLQGVNIAVGYSTGIPVGVKFPH